MFDDADGDSLTVSAASDDEAKATVTVASGGSSLTVSAQARGTATVTVTAKDGNGGTVDDDFSVTVKAAPVVASALADVSGLEEGATQDVSLSGVFTDADGDALTITATSSDETRATVTVASDGSKLTLSGVTEGTVTITVTAEDSDGNTVSDAFDVSVAKAPVPANRPPTVSNAIADATIVNESGTKQVSLTGVFSDADNDSLTITAESSDETKATVAVASDSSGLTVNAQARGSATITVTANDGNGGTVEDSFTVSVKAAPTVASALADVSGLEEGATQDVSLSGVFTDADGDTLTITATSSDDAKATVAVASNGSKLTLSRGCRRHGDHHGHGGGQRRQHGQRHLRRGGGAGGRGKGTASVRRDSHGGLAPARPESAGAEVSADLPGRRVRRPRRRQPDPERHRVELLRSGHICERLQADGGGKIQGNVDDHRDGGRPRRQHRQ